MNGAATVRGPVLRPTACAAVSADDGHARETRRLGGAGEDAVLVRRAAAGDRAAFGLLYERYARVVHGILLAHTVRADVDDLVHDVFLTALERLATLRDPGAFGAWLAAIARNRARMARRGARDVVPLGPAAEDVADPTPGPGPATDAALVFTAIGALPVAYREPLVLRLVEGLSGAEIAARTGLTPASVRVNLHRGMMHLRQKLGGSYG